MRTALALWIAAAALGQPAEPAPVCAVDSYSREKVPARGFELDADRLAVPMLIAAGFDPTAMVRYLSRTLPEGDTPRPTSPMPARSQRISGIEEAVRTAPPISTPAPVNGDFTRIQLEVRGLVPDRKPAQRNPPTLPRSGEAKQ